MKEIQINEESRRRLLKVLMGDLESAQYADKWSARWSRDTFEASLELDVFGEKTWRFPKSSCFDLLVELLRGADEMILEGSSLRSTRIIQFATVEPIPDFREKVEEWKRKRKQRES